MNQTQRNYAIDRVNRIARQKITDLHNERHRSPAPPTVDDVHDAIKSGKAKLKSKKALQDLMKEENRYGVRSPINLSLHAVFNNLPKPKGKKVNEAAYDKKINEIEQRQRTVIDEIMLGDEAAAMKLIADFEKELAKK